MKKLSFILSGLSFQRRSQLSEQFFITIFRKIKIDYDACLDFYSSNFNTRLLPFIGSERPQSAKNVLKLLKDADIPVISDPPRSVSLESGKTLNKFKQCKLKIQKDTC